MTSRGLKIALAVSVALNVFALAGGATAYVMVSRLNDRIDAQKPGRETSVHDIVATMDPGARARVRTALRASAMASRPDFEASRAARRQAVALSEAATFDPAQVSALLDQSRAAELRGRARLEADTIALLSTLDPKDRQAFAVVLTRKAGRMGRDNDRGERHGNGREKSRERGEDRAETTRP